MIGSTPNHELRTYNSSGFKSCSHVPWFQLPSVASQLIYFTPSCKIDKFSRAITIFTGLGCVELVSSVSSLPLLSASQSTERY